MGLPGLCLLLLAAAPAPPGEQLTLDFFVRLQGQVGTNVGVYTAAVGEDVQLEPGVILRERTRTAQLTLAYVPWFLYTPQEPNRILKLHRFRAEVTQQFDQRGGFFVNAIIRLGDQSYSPVINTGFPAAPPTFPGSLPPVAALKIFEATTRLGVFYRLTKELRLDATLGYFYTEGANPVDRLTLPLQRGPVLELKATYGVAKADELVGYVRSELLNFGPIFRSVGSPAPGGGSVAVQQFETGLSLVGSEFLLRWLHQVSGTINTELAGGVGLVNQSSSLLVAVPGGEYGKAPAQTNVYPVGEARLRDQLAIDEHFLGLTAAVAVLPTIDQFTAIVSERFNALLLANYGLSARWRLEALASATLAVNPRQLYILGSVQAVWQPELHVSLAAGARVGYVDYYNPTLLNGWSWVLYLAVSAGTGTAP